MEVVVNRRNSIEFEVFLFGKNVLPIQFQKSFYQVEHDLIAFTSQDCGTRRTGKER